MIKFVANKNRIFDDIPSATLEECVKYLESIDIFGIDTETEGLFNHSNKILMLQVGDKHTQYVIDVRGLDLSPLRGILQDETKLKLLWNASFDYKFLKMYGILKY